MAAHSAHGQRTRLPDVVPLDVPRLTRLSWELGSRVVDDEESTLHSRWEHEDDVWELDVYRVTDHTDLVRVRTPVRREHFYGVAQSDLESAVSALESASHWRRTG